MPPSRFSQVSRYRNASLVSAKAHDRFTELGLGALPDNGGIGRLLAVTPVSSHLLARTSTAPNGLLIVPADRPRKYGKQPAVLHGVCQGALADFDVSRFQADEATVVLAAGSTNGSIVVRTVALPSAVSSEEIAQLPSQKTEDTILSSERCGGVTSLHFHPSCAYALLSGSLQDNQVRVWNAENGSMVQEWDATTPQWDLKWSVDGSMVSGCGKDGIVRLWDARGKSQQGAVASFQAHTSKIKPTKSTFITLQTSHLLLTTGFSQMRQREIAIWDHRNIAKALQRTTLDVSSSGLDPVCDHDRGMVYMIGKGDSSVRWTDAGSQDQGPSFAEGVYSLDVSAASAALGTAAACDTTVGEVAKLYVATTSGTGSTASASDAIVPTSVRVPRRNFIDFHADLYPDTVDRAQDTRLAAQDWAQGNDISLEKISLNPLLKGRKTAAKPVAAVPASRAQQAEESPKPQPSKDVAAPVQSTSNLSAEAPTTAAQPASSLPPTNRPTAAPSTAVELPKVAIAATHSPVRTVAKQAEHSHWSRRPMAGSTPLISAYQNLSALDISRGPDARMIAVSRRYIFVPVSGPGGRLGVHPLAAAGRLPLHLPCLLHGTSLVDFVVDPFSDEQVITISADGIVRLWKVPEPTQGEQGLVLPAQLDAQVVQRVTIPDAGKVTELVPHPFVQGLVAVLPSEKEGQLHLVNVSGARIVASLELPDGCRDGLFSGTWSPDGSVLAVSAKDRSVYILDVRGRDCTARVLGHLLAHDSARSFRLAWIDDEHLLSVGHTVGSLRQLKLLKLDSSPQGLSVVEKHNMDASPSVLFPVWDRDTQILWLWSKGERIVPAFEIQPHAKETAAASASNDSIGGAARSMAAQQQQDIFTALPAFQHGTPQLGLAFVSKDCLDVGKVEVGAALRVTRSEVHRVAWNVPRSRPEFFQDDVFPPTVLARQPLLSVDKWMAGSDVRDVPLVSLQPSGMVALSQAPPPQQKVSSLSKGPTLRQLSDKEREDAMFTDIFAKAKGNDGDKDPNHNEDQAARAPDDDDWDED